MGIMILENTPMELLVASSHLYLSQFLDEIIEDYRVLNKYLEVFESEETALAPT